MKKRKQSFYNKLLIFSFILFIICLFIDMRRIFPTNEYKSKFVLAIYNPLFGNIENDQKFIGWKCKKSLSSNTFYDAPSELPIKLYPKRKLYSTHDKNILNEQMKELKTIGFDAILIKWYGIGRISNIFNEDDDSFAIKSIDLLMESCKINKMKFSIFLQNYEARNNETTSNDLNYILRKWSSDSNYLKYGNKPVIFIEEPYKSPNIFHAINFYKENKNVYFVSTFSQLQNIAEVVEYSFQAVCALPNYHYSTYSAKYDKWKYLQKEAHERGLFFFPAISPGYNTSITLNDLTKMKLKSRKSGDRYQKMFTEAINSNDGIIIINSYNDWIEGTNIEEAVEYKGFKYNDDLWTGEKGTSTDFLTMTKAFIKQFK